MKRSLAAILFVAFSTSALAQMSPVGVWKTIDDETKKEKSLVRIKETNGVFTGTCSDDRKGKPVRGMTIIRNIKANADDKGIWDGGDILDPNNGKVYRARLKPVDGGKKLEMRGYLGPFYRTQVWLRVE